jgi:hypothetical protein
MSDTRLSANRVVDLLRYRQEHQQRRLTFERRAPEPATLAPVTPFRTLSSREVDHRQAMIRHLTSSR